MLVLLHCAGWTLVLTGFQFWLDFSFAPLCPLAGLLAEVSRRMIQLELASNQFAFHTNCWIENDWKGQECGSMERPKSRHHILSFSQNFCTHCMHWTHPLTPESPIPPRHWKAANKVVETAWMWGCALSSKYLETWYFIAGTQKPDVS